MSKELLQNIYKLHTTPMGAQRIKRNLSLPDEEPVQYCKKLISDEKAVAERKGKNFYITAENCVITVNAHSYTIITAHKIKISKTP